MQHVPLLLSLPLELELLAPLQRLPPAMFRGAPRGSGTGVRRWMNHRARSHFCPRYMRRREQPLHSAVGVRPSPGPTGAPARPEDRASALHEAQLPMQPQLQMRSASGPHCSCSCVALTARPVVANGSALQLPLLLRQSSLKMRRCWMRHLAGERLNVVLVRPAAAVEHGRSGWDRPAQA